MRSPGATVRKRLVLLMGGFFLLFVCVMARLVDLQVFQAQELTERGMNQWTRSGIVSARRGDIVDTNGKLLAQSITSFIISARARDVQDPQGLAQVLERELALTRNRPSKSCRIQAWPPSRWRARFPARMRTGCAPCGRTTQTPIQKN